MTKIIYLNRQGVSTSYNTNQTKGLQYHVSIDRWQNTEDYIAEVVYWPRTNQWGKDICEVLFRVDRNHFSTVKREIEKKIKEKLGEDIRISRHIQSYSFKDKQFHNHAYTYVLSDFYFATACYHRDTENIKTMDNKVLVFFHSDDERKAEISIPSGTALYRLLNDCVKEYEKSHNQRGKVEEDKGWLAWLISEKIKESSIDMPIKPIKSMITHNHDNHYDLTEAA